MSRLNNLFIRLSYADDKTILLRYADDDQIVSSISTDDGGGYDYNTEFLNDGQGFGCSWTDIVAPKCAGCGLGDGEGNEKGGYSLEEIKETNYE